MNTALLFLLVRSVRGRVVRMLRRLREPKYLVGFLIGAGWMAFWLSGLVLGRLGGNVEFGMASEMAEWMAGPAAQVIQLGAAFAMAVGFTLWWAVPFGRSTLEFSEAELHMLLPAPVARRHLIQYAILRSQPPIMVGAAIVSVMSGGVSPIGLAARFFGVWVFFSAWDLHGKARGLWLAKLAELPPAAAWRKRILLYLFLLAFLSLLLFAAGSVVLAVMASPLTSADLPETFRDGEIDDGTRDALVTQVQGAWNGLLGWLLTPFLLTIRPYYLGFAEDSVLQVLAAWSFPLLMLVLHNEWVVRSQTRFEEAALDHAKRASRKLDPASRFWKQSMRARAWHPFPLAPVGRPEVAIVWKNLMIASRMPLTWMLAAGAAGVVVLAGLIATRLVPPWFAVVVQSAGGIFVLIAPLITARAMRQDLRNDLLKLETIRPWPIAGWRMFLAQVATPIGFAMLQCLAGAALYIAIDQLVLLGLVDAGRSLGARLAEPLGVPAALVGPLILLSWMPVALVLAALATSVENLAALTFPSWVQLGIRKAQAASRAGQNLLVFFVLSLVIAVGMAPGVVLVAAIVGVQVFVWGVPISGWELPLLGLLGALPVGAVVTALIRLGGTLWERLDPSAEILAGRA